MSLRLIYSALRGEFAAELQKIEQPIAKAATAAVREAAELAKAEGRVSIAAAGFSRKWQNALRARLYPPNRDSLRPAALIYHKVPYARVFEEGALIHGKPAMAAAAERPNGLRRPTHPGGQVPPRGRHSALHHSKAG
jgi:hypothetical protein